MCQGILFPLDISPQPANQAHADMRRETAAGPSLSSPCLCSVHRVLHKSPPLEFILSYAIKHSSLVTDWSSIWEASRPSLLLLFMAHYMQLHALTHPSFLVFLLVPTSSQEQQWRFWCKSCICNVCYIRPNSVIHSPLCVRRRPIFVACLAVMGLSGYVYNAACN